MTPEELERRRVLAVVAVELGEEVARLTVASAVQSEALDGLASQVKKKTYRTAVKIRWIIGLVVLDLVLSGGLLVGALRISELVTAQEMARSDVSCPILSDLLGSYDPTTRPPGRDRDVYERNKNLERHAFDTLHCQTDLVPPRTDLVTTTPPVPR